MHLNFKNMKKVAEKLRLLRQERGMSQQYVADSIGVSISTISRMESNPANIKLEMFAKIAQFHGMEFRKIFSDTENEVLQDVGRLVLQVSIPVSFTSDHLFYLASELQGIEKNRKVKNESNYI